MAKNPVKRSIDEIILIVNEHQDLLKQSIKIKQRIEAIERESSNINNLDDYNRFKKYCEKHMADYSEEQVRDAYIKLLRNNIELAAKYLAWTYNLNQVGDFAWAAFDCVLEDKDKTKQIVGRMTSQMVRLVYERWGQEFWEEVKDEPGKLNSYCEKYEPYLSDEQLSWWAHKNFKKNNFPYLEKIIAKYRERLPIEFVEAAEAKIVFTRLMATINTK